MQALKWRFPMCLQAVDDVYNCECAMQSGLAKFLHQITSSFDVKQVQEAVLAFSTVAAAVMTFYDQFGPIPMRTAC